MTDHHCQDFDQLIPELALGCLDGRERATALDHMRQCLRCRQELASYQGLASELLELIPAATPPAGFEIRALAAMKAPPRPGTAASRAGRRRSMMRAAVAAVLIAVAGIGGYEVSRLVSPPPPLHTAVLTARGHQVGTAYFFAGSQHWVWVTLHLGPRTRTVTCKIETVSGRRAITIGPLPLTAGHGAWGSLVAVPWQPGTVALILNSAKQTIATGTFRS
jgi:hypothetical protein